MKTILCIFFSSLIFLMGFCFADETYNDISFQLKTSLNLPDGNFKTSAKTESAVFELNSGIETEKFFEVKKAEMLDFKVNNFGLRFSPLLVVEGKKYIPCLSFYFGKLNYSEAFKKLISNNFSKPKYAKNISVKKNGNLSLSKSSLISDFGFQFMLKFFELNYVACKDKKLNSFNHAVFLQYNGKDLTDDKHDFLVASYFGFSPSIVQENFSKKQKYSGVFGTSLIYVNDYIALHGDFATSKSTEKDLGFSGNFNIQNFYEFFNIKLGVSANNKKFLGWKNTFPKNSLSFYIVPEISYDIFTLQFFYNLERIGLKRTKKGIVGTEKLHHKIGGKAETKNKYFKVLTSLEYGNKTYGLDFITAFYFPSLDFFKKLEAKWNCDLTYKSKNPYIIQKYGADLNLAFVPLECLSFDSGISFSQANKAKKIKIENVLTPVIEWQNYKIAGTAKLKYSIKSKINTNTFLLGIKVYNNEPFYDISLVYEIKR